VFQLEVELYHHPERYHTKKAGYSPKHDLYSLGVLLLEIALWTTMSKQFEGPIAKVQSMKMLPPLNVVEGAMDKLSQDPRVAREMEAEYARIIRRCLKTDFDVDKHDEGWTALLGQFDALVVEQLSRSMSL
jgi:serine/threonine protein kinase